MRKSKLGRLAIYINYNVIKLEYNMQNIINKYVGLHKVVFVLYIDYVCIV